MRVKEASSLKAAGGDSKHEVAGFGENLAGDSPTGRLSSPGSFLTKKPSLALKPSAPRLDSRIFVAGHRGLVGSAILSALKERGFNNLITRTRDELDLLDFAGVDRFFEKEKPQFVFMAAAKVGGILANDTYRADFLYENLALQNSVIFNAYKHGVKKLLFLGSSCIYPSNKETPIMEDDLLSAPLEYTNEPYAIAKIAGLRLCESLNLQYGTNFLALMPTNLYGREDNFNLLNSHVIPALLRKMHLAKLLARGEEEAALEDLCRDIAKSKAEARDMLGRFLISKDSVGIWGSGRPRREFLHSKDLAAACLYVMERVDFCDLHSGEKVRNTHINVGSGTDLSISELAGLVKEIVGFEGALNFDTSKPDGTFRKLMDSSRLAGLGFRPSISLEDGLSDLYRSYCDRFYS